MLENYETIEDIIRPVHMAGDFYRYDIIDGRIVSATVRIPLDKPDVINYLEQIGWKREQTEKIRVPCQGNGQIQGWLPPAAEDQCIVTQRMSIYF
ncbi:hypothetical protein LKD70_09295 [Ruminococcus sp. CLA-AA-H200]|uniref:Uncharacterized protein n=1 Tax=Ruminococcus turbiniformis TaxID=2881258 RepID=A0ABS8FX36_9FIRM|nr:hypothetical protein [Ruminococcus turbiniformis]MCC2254610.1 hypothetical protein [Ruminococcus turbiniformis]